MTLLFGAKPSINWVLRGSKSRGWIGFAAQHLNADRRINDLFAINESYIGTSSVIDQRNAVFACQSQRCLTIVLLRAQFLAVNWA